MSDLFGNEFESIRIDTGTVQIHLRHGGQGPALLLLHGYPQTHVMWHRVAPELARHYRLVMPDLRGYGDSSKSVVGQDVEAFAKREMARDVVAVMDALGHDGPFFVAGHDRGGRVTHRLALDFPERVAKACVMDIAPTLHMFDSTDQTFATAYYHWFFLIQPDALPEHLIGLDPDWYLREKLRRWAGPGARFDAAAVEEYLRCFRQPDAIESSCNDYRAAASIDLEHDRQDLACRVECPLLVLWGDQGFVHRNYDVLDVWRERATQVEGQSLRSGHFLPEEAPTAVIRALRRFFV